MPFFANSSDRTISHIKGEGGRNEQNPGENDEKPGENQRKPPRKKEKAKTHIKDDGKGQKGSEPPMKGKTKKRKEGRKYYEHR